MTEQEWLECTDPTVMLAFLRGNATKRKMRLFAVACCRRVLHLLTDARSRTAVDVAERFADGLSTEGEMEAARSMAHNALTASPSFAHPDEWTTLEYAASAAEDAAFPDADRGADSVSWATSLADSVDTNRTTNIDTPDANCVQADSFRCIFGPLPFRPITVNPHWRTSTVRQLAEIIYTKRDFDLLPILADALLDANCNQQDILTHLKASRNHCRGCWVLDLILGKK